MSVKNEFQKWATNRLREIALCGVTSVLVIGADCGPAHAAGWISIPGLRKKDKEPVEEKRAVDHSEAIFRAMNEAKAADKKGNIDRAMIHAERAMRLAESNVSEDEPGSKVLATATTTYYNELKTRKAEGSDKKTSTKSDEQKVANKPKAKPVEETAPAKVAAEEKPKPQKPAKQQTAKQNPKVHRSGTVDERATISKAMKSEMEPSGTRPSDTKAEIGKSSALAEALETPKQPLKPTRRYEKKSTIPVTPVLSKVAEKPNGSEETKPAEKAPVTTVANVKQQLAVSEPEIEPEFDPFPDDRPKKVPAEKIVTRKKFTELWDAQGETEQKTKSAEPAWTAEKTEKPQNDDLFNWADKQDEFISRADEPADDKELVDARRSMRIKLRPRHAGQEVPTPATTMDFATATPEQEGGPQIHPMLRSNQSARDILANSENPSHDKVTIRSFDDEVNDSRTEIPFGQKPESESTSIADTESQSWNDDDDSSNDNFPTRKVLDLKRRLESCASLQPGEIAQLPVSNPLTEFFAVDEEEAANEGVAQTKVVPSESADDWEEPLKTEVATVAEAEPGVNDEESNEVTPKRVIKAEVTARMSLIRWRAAADDVNSSSDVTTNELPDIREALITDSRSEKQSLFSVPSVNISLNETSRLPEKPPVQKVSSWDNAPAPKDELSLLAGSNRKLKPGHELNSEIAPPAPVEQISFEGRQQNGLPSTNGGELVTASVIEIPDLNSPSVANVSYSEAGLRGTPFNENELHPDSSTEVVLSGPVERFAFVCGISTPAAAAFLGALATALGIAGFIAMQSVVRVALVSRNET